MRALNYKTPHDVREDRLRPGLRAFLYEEELGFLVDSDRKTEFDYTTCGPATDEAIAKGEKECHKARARARRERESAAQRPAPLPLNPQPPPRVVQRLPRPRFRSPEDQYWFYVKRGRIMGTVVPLSQAELDELGWDGGAVGSLCPLDEKEVWVAEAEWRAVRKEKSL